MAMMMTTLSLCPSADTGSGGIQGLALGGVACGVASFANVWTEWMRAWRGEV